MIDKNGNQTVIYASCTNFIDIADINDNTPRFSSAKYTARFSRLTKVGDIIDVVHAEDKDAGENANISYSLRELEDGDATVNFTDYFEVNATSGIVRLVKLIDPTVMSKLTKITGEVVATDGGNPPQSTAVLIVMEYINEVEQVGNNCTVVLVVGLVIGPIIGLVIITLAVNSFLKRKEQQPIRLVSA